MLQNECVLVSSSLAHCYHLDSCLSQGAMSQCRTNACHVKTEQEVNNTSVVFPL